MKKIKTDFIIEIILLLISFIVLLFPSFKMTNLKLVLAIIYGSYTVLKLISFMINKKTKDYEGLITSIVSVGALALTFVLKETTRNFVIILLLWIALISLVKLKKSDFYHDRKNKLWMLRVFNLVVFIISGILTSINLLHESEIQILIIVYFFVINNVLNLTDPIASYISEAK